MSRTLASPSCSCLSAASDPTPHLGPDRTNQGLQSGPVLYRSVRGCCCTLAPCAWGLPCYYLVCVSFRPELAPGSEPCPCWGGDETARTPPHFRPMKRCFCPAPPRDCPTQAREAHAHVHTHAPSSPHVGTRCTHTHTHVCVLPSMQVCSHPPHLLHVHTGTHTCTSGT